ncbi:MAG: hypothetical protein U1E78_04260 [Gammaproteobacteria bacterium]
MIEIDSDLAIDVSGGLAMLSNDGILVTGNSKLTMQGLVFLADSICQNDTCSNDMFKAPVTYTLTGKYNGKNVVSIVGQYIDGGAKYIIS